MGQFLSNSKMKEFCALFVYYDYFNNGKIALESVHEILRSMTLKLSLEEVHELIKETTPVDATCATVTLTQFLTIVSIIVEDKIVNKEIYQIFEIFDANKNNIIDEKDFQVGFKNLQTDLSQEQILRLIQSSQKNKLNLREFRRMILDR